MQLVQKINSYNQEKSLYAAGAEYLIRITRRSLFMQLVHILNSYN